MALPWMAVGALCCAVGVIAGAFGAHGLESRIDAAAMALWQTAVQYFMYGALGLVLVGLAAQREPAPGLDRAGLCLLLGMLIFSGTVAALSLGAPRWFGAVTPFGGLLLILGFLLFAWTALRV